MFPGKRNGYTHILFIAIAAMGQIEFVEFFRIFLFAIKQTH